MAYNPYQQENFRENLIEENNEGERQRGINYSIK